MHRSVHLLLVASLSMAVAACGPQENDHSANELRAPVVQQSAPEPTVVPRVDQPLARRDLLLAAMEAGSNHVLGVDDKAEQQRLDGRTFTFRMRLCGDTANVSQSFDQETRVWKVEVQPDLGIEDAVVRRISDQVVAVEGFWIAHPFLLQHGCPRNAPASSASETAQDGQQQSVGIAQFFGPDEVRADQRGSRPYSITEELAEGQAPEAVDLVLQGRLQRLDSGKVIHCVDNPNSARPVCMVSVKLDRVQLETGSGRSLGEWSRS